MEEDGEKWKKEYEQWRYLRHTPDYVLEERRVNLAQNFWSTDRDGNITKPRCNNHRRGIIRLYVHTLLELAARLNSSVISFDERAVREEASANYQPPSLNVDITFEPSCISKFGQKKYIQASLKEGQFRIAPASSYGDPSLNAAQIDQELENISQTPNESLIFNLYGSTSTGGKVQEINVEKGELFRYRNSSDFYVWSCAFSYDARMFREFEATAALIVHEPVEFERRMIKAVAAKLPYSRSETGSLEYYDPYNIKHDELRRGFSKNFKYLYQNEYRFAWWVSEVNDLEPFFIEMGSIKDIASVIELCS